MIKHWINKLYSDKWWIFANLYEKAVRKNEGIEITFNNQKKIIPKEKVQTDFYKDHRPMPDGNWIYFLKENNKLIGDTDINKLPVYPEIK